jgi:glutathione S-transferase
MPQPLTLHTFSISHFSEKTRWMLDTSGIAYVEKPWVPGLHVPRALKAGGFKATTVPVLITEQGAVQDSTRILLWLEQHRAPFALMPADAALRQQVLDIEDRFDRIGAHVVRYAYRDALDDAEGIKTVWTLDANPLERLFVCTAFPLMRAGFRRGLQLNNAEVVAKSEKRILDGMDWLAERTGSQLRYLVGDTLTAADITAAALLSPLACPDEHAVYSRPDFQKGVAPLKSRHEQHPAMVWVRWLYRQHRQPR